MPIWTVIVSPDEREHVVRAEELEVAAGALIFRRGGVITQVFAPTGYASVRLEDE